MELKGTICNHEDSLWIRKEPCFILHFIHVEYYVDPSKSTWINEKSLRLLNESLWILHGSTWNPTLYGISRRESYTLAFP